MSDAHGPIYEVTISVAREAANEVDSWLEEHVEAMLDVPGLFKADSYAWNADDERVSRVTRYHFESEAHLAAYLENDAPKLRAHSADAFGDQVRTTRRTLRDVHAATQDPDRLPRCTNCDALLGGQYCGVCGQRATSRLISLWQLVRDAFGDLLDADSRVWKTLGPLAVRPGKLTYDYLRGKRARYLPPFRTYLVLSLAFFLIALFNPREQLGVFFVPDENSTAQTATSSPFSVELRADLEEDGVPTDCALEGYPYDMPPWLASRLTKQRVRGVCEQFMSDEDQALSALGSRIIDNIPVSLLILLPIMALVLKVLYPISRRYYVEHVVFVLHFHAFVFLLLTVMVLWSRLIAATGLPYALDEAVEAFAYLYVPVYLYRSMRKVYGQHALIVLAKLLILLAAYFAGLTLIFSITALLAVFAA